MCKLPFDAIRLDDLPFSAWRNQGAQVSNSVWSRCDQVQDRRRLLEDFGAFGSMCRLNFCLLRILGGEPLQIGPAGQSQLAEFFPFSAAHLIVVARSAAY